MAGWQEFMGSRLRLGTRQVILVTGELSNLVYDRVVEVLKGMEFYVRANEPDHITSTSLLTGGNSAYYIVNPSKDMLKAAEEAIRRRVPESFVILIGGDTSKYPKESLEYIKRRAQQSKNYFTLTAPKTDAAREKMVSDFLMLWSVTRDIATRVCSGLEYSPGRLYSFTKKFLMCTQGEVMPSSQTSAIIDEILGEDQPHMVVMNILNQRPVDLEFSEEFTGKVLRLLHGLVLDAKAIQEAMAQGHSTVKSIAAATRLSQFHVHKAMGIAEVYRPEELFRGEELLMKAQDNIQGNPDLLSVVSRLW